MHLIDLPRSTRSNPIQCTSPSVIPNVTFQTQAQKSTVFHKGRQFLFKTALTAAPVAALACFSPAQAINVSFSGFTGAFDKANWVYSGNGTGNITTTPNRMTFSIGAGPTQSTGKFTYNLATLNNYAPVNPNPGKKYIFDTGKVEKARLQASFPDFAVDALDSANTISFALVNDLTENPGPFEAGLGRVSDFEYVATYKEVPGPLPVAAAVGAFAWSRTIRRRLSAASQA
jgi:hypothetical protein